MTNYPKLNFPPIHLRARHGIGRRTEVFDAVRGRWLVLTPEEWVRRHVVEYLRHECGFASHLIIEEYPVALNGMAQRADIVVMSSNAKPLLVVECKEPGIKIGDDVLRQVVRYNSVLECKYIAMTNGIDTFCYEYDKERYLPTRSFPKNNTSSTEKL